MMELLIVGVYLVLMAGILWAGLADARQAQELRSAICDSVRARGGRPRT